MYSDGSVFTNADGAPEDAPGAGVVAIGQEDDTVGSVVHYGMDFYAFAEQYSGWYGLDAFGFAQHIARPGRKIVKLGESMSTEGYKRVLAEMRDGGHLPAKSARYPWERRL